MVTILETLGKNWKNIKLFDNETPYGGISYHGETLENFMTECKINEEDDFGKLQKALKENGIMQIDKGDIKIDEIIKQKIWDIENELNINIIDYRWDYK